MVGQRVKVGGLDSQEGIKEVRKRDAFRLRDKPEELPVGVKRPHFARRLDLKPRLVVAVDQSLTRPPAVVGIGERESTAPVPLGLDDLDRSVG